MCLIGSWPRASAVLAGWLALGRLGVAAPNGDAPFCRSELLFPLEGWHNHASCIVETPAGDLLVAWFHGSGERTADDVKIEGARLRRGSTQWSDRFVMADTPGYPDTNPALFIDPRGHLWLFWPTILNHRWESALLKYRTSEDYAGEGPPRWKATEVLHVTPGTNFVDLTTAFWDRALPGASEGRAAEAQAYAASLRSQATNELSRRLGWMTRAHPVLIGSHRLLVPLYSDGFDCSLMVFSDDGGETWQTSDVLPGLGNVQPSLARRRDGTLYALMRDNGPPPQRLHQSDSKDGGKTWSPVTDSPLSNPGSGAEIITLRNGHWVLIGNDTEDGRHQLAVQLSEDEGRTWPWKRYLEHDPAGPGAGSFHYPSLIQAADGSLHASYSYHSGNPNLPRDANGRPLAKAIKHAHFNEAWIRETPTSPSVDQPAPNVRDTVALP